MENNPYEPPVSKKRSIHRVIFLVAEILFVLILIGGVMLAFVGGASTKQDNSLRRWAIGIQNYESIPLEPQLPSPTSNP